MLEYMELAGKHPEVKPSQFHGAILPNSGMKLNYKIVYNANAENLQVKARRWERV